MGISVRCENPVCNKSLKLRDELAGKRLKCPGCGHLLVVPTGVPNSAPGDAPVDAAHASHRPKTAKSVERLRAIKAETPADEAEGSAGVPWPWISTGAALLLVVAVTVWALIASSSASKATSEADAVRAEAAASRTDKEMIEADLTRTKTELAVATLERKKLSGELASLTGNLEQTKSSLTKSQTDANETKKQLDLLNPELTAAKAELAKAKADAEAAKETPKPPRSPPDPPKATVEMPVDAAGEQVTILNGHSQAVVVAIKDVPGAFKLKPNEKVGVKLPLDKDYTLTVLAGDRVNIVFPVKATAGIVWRIRPIVAGQDSLSVFSEVAGAPAVAPRPEPPAEAMFLVPLGPTPQQVVEEIIAQMNQHVIKLRDPAPGTAVLMPHPGGDLPRTMQGKKVRWQGTVVENTDPGSKFIKIRVANLQAPGQVFLANFYADPVKGTPPPAAGAEVWVEGFLRKDWGGTIYLANIERMLTVELAMPVAGAKLLKAQP